MTTIALIPQATTATPTTTAPDGRARAIDRAASLLARKHPQCAAMIERAAEIAKSGRLHLTTTVATVEGRDGRTYTLRPVGRGRWACDCSSFINRPTMVDGRPHCKHTAALALTFYADGGF